MSKDRLYGGLILVVSLVITVSYIVAFFSKTLSTIFTLPDWLVNANLDWWTVAIPVFLFVLVALVVCMWIGWTMLTTPPPAPLEDIEA